MAQDEQKGEFTEGATREHRIGRLVPPWGEEADAAVAIAFRSCSCNCIARAFSWPEPKVNNEKIYVSQVRFSAENEKNTRQGWSYIKLSRVTRFHFEGEIQ